VVISRFFSRSEHCQGRLCETSWAVAYLQFALRDGLLKTLLDSRAYQGRQMQMALGGSQIDPEPKFFKEGEDKLIIDN